MDDDLICSAAATRSQSVSTANGVVVDQVLSSDEAADFLKISRSTLPSWRIRGKSPPWRKLGKRVVYLRSDLEKFIAAIPATTFSGGKNLREAE